MLGSTTSERLYRLLFLHVIQLLFAVAAVVILAVVLLQTNRNSRRISVIEGLLSQQSTTAPPI